MAQGLAAFVQNHPVAVIVVGLVLSALGAWQALVWIYRGIAHTTQEIRRRSRNRHAHGEYYYRERISEYRIPLDGGVYFHRRTDVLVPLTPILHKARLGYRWTADGDKTPPTITCLTPGRTVTIVRDDADHDGGQGWKGWVLQIDPPLKKNLFRKDVCRYVSTTVITPTKRPEPFYSTKSEKRLDRLLIRVAFPPERLPQNVRYRIVDSYDEDLQPPIELPVDSLTGLCQVEQKNPQPFVRHKVVWDW